MRGDLGALYAKATCVLLLVWAYQPFGSDELIPAYYLAANSAYSALKSFVDDIARTGAFVKADSYVPARALALQAGLGQAGLNGLLYIGELGSRIALYTVFTDACKPADANVYTHSLNCGSCLACVNTCPADAIDPVLGLKHEQCLRTHMTDAFHPDWVLRSMPSYLGCELCQAICPANSGIAVTEPDETSIAAFDMEALILGNTAAARALAGRNFTGSGKLSAEAIAFAKRSNTGRWDDKVKAALKSPFKAVKDAALWYFET